MDRLLGKNVGPYLLTRCLGAGGMGSVYLGEHRGIGSRVAVKILHPRFLSKSVVTRRFLNEAKLANKIDHPGIVRIFDCGLAEGIGVFLLMEYLEGESLLSRWKAEGRLAARPAVDILLQIASAMSAAHRRNIVHRDLKLSNIFLVADPLLPGGCRAKVLDFGVAKLLSANQGTATGELLGTRIFMSPEQVLDSRKVDHRADIYSLGVMAYLLLSGEQPFTTEQMERMIFDHILPVPAPLRCPGAAFPKQLEHVVMRAIARERAERYLSMADLAEDLQRALPGSPLAPPDAAPPQPGTSGGLTAPDGVAERAVRDTVFPATQMESREKAMVAGRRRSSRAWLFVAMVAALLLVGLVVMGIGGSGGGDPRPDGLVTVRGDSSARSRGPDQHRSARDAAPDLAPLHGRDCRTETVEPVVPQPARRSKRIRAPLRPTRANGSPPATTKRPPVATPKDAPRPPAKKALAPHPETDRPTDGTEELKR